MNDNSFNNWLRFESGKKYLAITAILGLIYSALQFAKLLNIEVPKTYSFEIHDNVINSLPYLIQILFITFVIFGAAFKYKSFEDTEIALGSEMKIWENLRLHKDDSKKPKNDKEKEKLWIKYKVGVNKVVRQFVNFWLLCWIVWLIFYILLVAEIFGYKLEYSVINFANNINALFFIYLFMTLSVSTSKYGAWKWFQFGFIIFMIFVLNCLLEDNKTFKIVFSLFSSLFAGLAMSAFVGSINSRTINIPIWVLLLLNLYCAIQPFYFLFVNDEIIVKGFADALGICKIIILLLAFFLKIIMFLLVTWILQTGRLLHFIIQEGSLNFTKEEPYHWLKVSANLKNTDVFKHDSEI